jgi:uncharacterized coiled-coil DUF342 family protein
MSTAFDKFVELESRIMRAVELLKATRREKEAIEREVQELRRERDLIKNKVETLLESLSELSEETNVESEVASNRR